MMNPNTPFAVYLKSTGSLVAVTKRTFDRALHCLVEDWTGIMEREDETSEEDSLALKSLQQLQALFVLRFNIKPPSAFAKNKKWLIGKLEKETEVVDPFPNLNKAEDENVMDDSDLPVADSEA